LKEKMNITSEEISLAEEKMPHSMGFVKDIAIAYVSQHHLPISQISDLLQHIYSAYVSLKNACQGSQGSGTRKPAVPIDQSITPDYLICLEDGKKLRMLKRHLRTAYKLSPERYRERWNLPPDYPMVAPRYAQKRSLLAKSNGLGRARSRLYQQDDAAIASLQPAAAAG
jgi:predicted transcriptional regulator